MRATVARTAPAENFFEGAAAGGGVAFRRRDDGGYKIAAGGTNEHFISRDSFRHFFKFQPALRASARNISLRFDNGLIDRMFPQTSWREDEQSPFEKTRILNPEPSQRSLASIEKACRNMCRLLQMYRLLMPGPA